MKKDFQKIAQAFTLAVYDICNGLMIGGLVGIVAGVIAGWVAFLSLLVMAIGLIGHLAIDPLLDEEHKL